ncbi:hypothetical protein N8Y37_06395, partial [Amylibacter sp.]|nr:hypothetical protein [Amylibacter sp.]
MPFWKGTEITRLFSYSPNDLEEIQYIYLNYVNQEFPECTCGCRGFPINILTLEFNESEVDLSAYISCPARHNRKRLSEYAAFKKDPIYKKFLKEIYPERYGNRPPSSKKSIKENEQTLRVYFSNARTEAINNNEKTFQGKPCINGHHGIRHV